MPHYDSSDPAIQQRDILGTKVYMASHPLMRPFFRGEDRPAYFGDKVWDTTLSLIRHLSGRRFGRVVDLGCGWGVLGVHLARTSRASVTCIDRDPRLAPVVALQAELNDVEVRFRSARFDELRAEELAADLLVGAEICYSASVCDELIALLERAAEAGAGEALVADPDRPDFERLVDFGRDRFGATVTSLPGAPGRRAGRLLTIPLRDRKAE